jgi:hypothetical protein
MGGLGFRMVKGRIRRLNTGSMMKVRIVEKGGKYYPQYRRMLRWYCFSAPGYKLKAHVCDTQEEAMHFLNNTEEKVVAEFKI